MDGSSWPCTGGSDQDIPQEKAMRKGKIVVWGGLTNSCAFLNFGIQKNRFRRRILIWRPVQVPVEWRDPKLKSFLEWLLGCSFPLVYGNWLYVLEYLLFKRNSRLIAASIFKILIFWYKNKFKSEDLLPFILLFVIKELYSKEYELEKT